MAVRQIGIGDNARRIIAKAILTITRMDIQDAASSLQLCADQISGIEAAVNAVDSLFQQEETEATLLVDTMHSIHLIVSRPYITFADYVPRSSLATALINSYRAPTELFVGGEVLYLREGTTQGDPLAMPMYALATYSPYQEAIVTMSSW